MTSEERALAGLPCIRVRVSTCGQSGCACSVTGWLAEKHTVVDRGAYLPQCSIELDTGKIVFIRAQLIEVIHDR